MAETKVLTKYIDAPNQSQIKTYEANGGYQALKKAIPNMSPEEVLKEVMDSDLRGRGGAGFPTGKKWSFIPKDPSLPKYLVCNCDESEPGTFKDRLLTEKDPHQLIEGVILASYAIDAHHAFIYCRGEFFEAIAKLQGAVDEAKQAGYVGKNILGSDYHLDIIIQTGAGAYIAGEETALLNSLEGYRATPRLKPPFPAIKGLYAKPTIVNNVETLCNVVHIVKNSPAWFKMMGKPNNYGTKIFQVSGQVQKPGCFEFALGVPLEEVLNAAGGPLPGRKFKAFYPGGSSCALLLASDIRISMDFESLAARGTALGTASIIVMDDTADMVKVAERLMEFYQNESCGKCTPCREGTRWIVQILGRILAGRGTYSDLKTIESVCRSLETQSFCPLAIGAAPPIFSAMRDFKEEFITYIKRNPYAESNPKMPMAYPYQASNI